MTSPTDLPPPPLLPTAVTPAPVAARWERRIFHAPRGAKWVPLALQKIIGAPGQPALRHLMAEETGWTIEECQRPECLPVAEFLTQSGASIWAFVSIVQQSLAALSTLHEAGLAHGNVSAATLRVDPQGNVVLAKTAAGHPMVLDESQPGADAPPPVPQGTVNDDLRDLGRAFRAVLCGDPDAKVTTTRPDIAPMVAAWIDWLVTPLLGRYARSASHAATVLNDLRTGKPGRKPWEEDVVAPSYVLPETRKPDENAGKGAGLFDGAATGGNLRGVLLSALAILGLVGGSILALNHYYKDKKIAGGDNQALPPAGGAGLNGLTFKGTSNASLMMPGELAFDGIAAGYDPAKASPEQIENLMKALPKEAAQGITSTLTEWAQKLQSQSPAARTPETPGDTAASAGNSADSEWLYSPEVFPIIGKPSSGRTPGDYYIVWRTHQFVMTQEECRALQLAILKSAGFCGVQVLSWTVLPNQAGAVIRAPKAEQLSDEVLRNRIALLRGEKAAAAIFSQITAAEKAGDTAAADKVRVQWNTSMGSAAGFLSVVRSVPVVSKEVLGKVPLWQQKPLRLHSLTPDTNELLHAAGIVDTAAVRAKFVAAPGDWPLCSFTASMHKYKPSLYGVAVLMQRNPYRTLPPTPKEELLNALNSWRRYLGDFPASLTGPADPPQSAATNVATPSAPAAPEAPALK